ncbi:MAG: hypothetical protein JST46_18775 [Bacteroidetes bacterium]|nr:hypothetical protein [Bacteroidota bacterium]
MKVLSTILSVLILTACKAPSNKQSQPKKWNIVGSWYMDLKDGNGAFDTVMNYAEIYVNDTALYYQEELMGQSQLQSYFVRNDTLYKCFGIGKDCEFIPMYRLDDMRNDTLWVTINSRYTKGGTTAYWVRLPSGEKGHFDHIWTKETSDSLGWAVVYDYDRRKWKYYATKGNRLDEFDSMLRAGTWKWNMKDQEIQDYLERKRKRGD